MDVRVTIEGADDVIRYLKSSNLRERRVAEKATQVAARKTKAFIQRRIPARWKKSMKAKVYKGRSNFSGANIGLYTGRSQGHQNPGYKVPIDDFLKAYWMNYGTMGSRDRTHHFTKRVRPEKQGRRGVTPQHFFEDAIKGWEQEYFRTFETEFNRQIEG